MFMSIRDIADFAMEIEVKVPAGFDLRTDLLLVRQLSVSRSRIKKWCGEGLILSSGRILSPKSRVKDGMLLQIKKEIIRRLHE